MTSEVGERVKHRERASAEREQGNVKSECGDWRGAGDRPEEHGRRQRETCRRDQGEHVAQQGGVREVRVRQSLPLEIGEPHGHPAGHRYGRSHDEPACAHEEELPEPEARQMGAQRHQHRFIVRQLRTEQERHRTREDHQGQPAQLTHVVELQRQMDSNRGQEDDGRRNHDRALERGGSWRSHAHRRYRRNVRNQVTFTVSG